MFMACIGACSGSAGAQSEETLPLWDYGVGIGYLQYFHYPAANQSNTLVLPFPTFQYRGEILRADDQEGARAYLLRASRWSLQLGGGLIPSVKSTTIYARDGMDPLPSGFQLGPQAVYKMDVDWEFKLGLYQSFFTDLKKVSASGDVGEAKIIWHLDDILGNSNLFGPVRNKGQLSFELKAASREFMSVYYDVSPEDTTVDRPAYGSQAGFLSYGLGYFQSLAYRKHTFYFGFLDERFNDSVNRRSPLHRSDENLSLFLGITHTLGTSESKSISEDEAKGLLQKIKK
jgi:outer membrane protein